MQYQAYLNGQTSQKRVPITSQSQALSRSQSVQQPSRAAVYAPTTPTLPSKPTNNSISRQQSAPLSLPSISDLYSLQGQVSSSEPALPGLPKPPCVSLQRRQSVKSDSSPTTDSASTRYKTEMCRPFEETGNCRYGSKCQFAHGIHELRSLNRHPRYKTEFCRTFHTTGFCSYGQRCNFIHNEDERRGSQPTSPTTSRPKGLSLNTASSASLKSSTGSLGSAGSLMSSTSVSPASSVYGDATPPHSLSYLSDDASCSRLSPTPSLSSETSFPSPTGGPSMLLDDPFEFKSAAVDFSLSFSVINSLNL